MAVKRGGQAGQLSRQFSGLPSPNARETEGLPALEPQPAGLSTTTYHKLILFHRTLFPEGNKYFYVSFASKL